MLDQFEAKTRRFIKSGGKTAQITIRLGLPLLIGGGAAAVNAPDILSSVLNDSESSRNAYAQAYPTRTPTPSRAESFGSCLVIIDPIREQFYLDKGGSRDVSGRPQFQPEIDQILGPAFITGEPKRRVLAEAIGQAHTLEVDSDGIARRVTDPRNPANRSSKTEFKGNCDTNEAKIKVNGQERNAPGMIVSVQSLNSGYRLIARLAANLENYTHPVSITSQKPGVETVTGPTVVPQGERMDKTPVPAAQSAGVPKPEPSSSPARAAQPSVPIRPSLGEIRNQAAEQAKGIANQFNSTQTEAAKRQAEIAVDKANTPESREAALENFIYQEELDKAVKAKETAAGAGALGQGVQPKPNEGQPQPGGRQIGSLETNGGDEGLGGLIRRSPVIPFAPFIGDVFSGLGKIIHDSIPPLGQVGDEIRKNVLLKEGSLILGIIAGAITTIKLGPKLLKQTSVLLLGALILAAKVPAIKMLGNKAYTLLKKAPLIGKFIP